MPQQSSTTRRTRTPRSTKAETERRVRAVRRWITDENVAVEEAVERLQRDHGIGRRQALRYWVRAYVELLSPEDRCRHDRGHRPRDREGRYRPWSILSPGRA